MGYPLGKQWVSIVSHVALALLNFLQFFSLKSIEKWPSYTFCKFEGPSPSNGHMARHLVATGTPNLEIGQIGQLGLPEVPP